MYLKALCDVEGSIGMRLPGDLRRILLEVGDVGRHLFGAYVLQGMPASLVEGTWPLPGRGASACAVKTGSESV